jgi:hypothetical protein
MLGLTLLELDRREEALAQLRIVRETNQDNEQLKALITQIETGQFVSPQASSTQTITDGNQATKEEGGAVVSPSAPDTDLVSPVNAGGNNANGQSESQPSAQL